MYKDYLSLKEYNFPLESFIGGWYIPDYICDNVIQYFHKNKNEIKNGCFANASGRIIDISTKDSLDLGVDPKNTDNCMYAYQNYLGACFKNYLSKYNFINKSSYFSLNTSYNIQYYKIKGGFKKWHFERTSTENKNSRVLVFMTYLNDVDDGGTEFFYQNIKTKAEKGLTLLWPTDFTHTHRGIISATKEKYIVTGWYTYD
jgi:prolyl 4-hydroxylase